MLRDRAGIIDISNFAKYRCKGPGASDWLNSVFANNMPKGIGRSCLTPLIGVRGGIAGDATVTRVAEDEFWIVSSGMAERYHKRFFDAVPLPEGTTFESFTEAMCGFNVAGPKSRELLATAHQCVARDRRFPLHALATDRAGGRQMPGAAGFLHRRSGVGAALQHRRPETALRGADRGGQGFRCRSRLGPAR